MRSLLALAAAVLLGLFLPAPWPHPSLPLGLLLSALTVLAAPGWTGRLSLGLPGDFPPIERGAP